MDTLNDVHQQKLAIIWNIARIYFSHAWFIFQVGYISINIALWQDLQYFYLRCTCNHISIIEMLENINIWLYRVIYIIHRTCDEEIDFSPSIYTLKWEVDKVWKRQLIRYWPQFRQLSSEQLSCLFLLFCRYPKIGDHFLVSFAYIFI